jgi:hypothetical protein
MMSYLVKIRNLFTRRTIESDGAYRSRLIVARMHLAKLLFAHAASKNPCPTYSNIIIKEHVWPLALNQIWISVSATVRHWHNSGH